MKKTKLAGVAFVMGCSLQLLGGDELRGQWWWPPDVGVTPEEPTCADRVTLMLGGEWPDSCIPNGSDVGVVGQTIYLDVFLNYPPDIHCLQIITPWLRWETVSLLDPGTYIVIATAYRNSLPVWEPTEVGSLTVTVNSGDIDCDDDIDLEDFGHWTECATGPQSGPLFPGCDTFDFDGDADVDLGDYSDFLVVFAR